MLVETPGSTHLGGIQRLPLLLLSGGLGSILLLLKGRICILHNSRRR